MTTPDARIWQSAWNISQAQENLNKLFEAFDLIECRHQGLVIEFDDADECEGEFIQPVWNAYYTVKRKTRSNAKVEGWITLAIQLTCDEGKEASWVFGKRAKVLVGYNRPFAPRPIGQDHRREGDAAVIRHDIWFGITLNVRSRLHGAIPDIADFRRSHAFAAPVRGIPLRISRVCTGRQTDRCTRPSGGAAIAWLPAVRGRTMILQWTW